MFEKDYLPPHHIPLLLVPKLTTEELREVNFGSKVIALEREIVFLFCVNVRLQSVEYMTV